MGENNNNLTLREAIEQGFAAENNNPAFMPQIPETGAGVPAGEAPQAADAAAAPVQDASTQTQIPFDTGAPNDGTPAEASAVPQEQPAQAANPAQGPDQSSQMFQIMMEQMRQLQAQNAQLQQALSQAQGTVQEQSRAAEGAMDNAMTQPTVTVPILDFNELQYDDDATRTQKLTDWQNALTASIRDSVEQQYAGQIAPIIAEYQAKIRESETARAKDQLYGDPRFADFRDRDAQIEHILSTVPELGGLSPDKRYLLGGMIARGMAYQSQPTAEDLVRQVQANPDALRMLDTERARTIADRNGQIPTIMPSSGMSTANAIPDEIPKDMNDMRDRIAAAMRRG